MGNPSYKCLIVDDEPIAIRVIKNHLAEFNSLHVAGECSNAIEAIEILSKDKIDLIFLDIQMPQITGIELLKSLDYPPKIIFTTAYRDYALDAFDLDVVDYLLKPVSLVRFTKAINRFYNRVNESQPTEKAESALETPGHIFLKSDKKLHKVRFADILFVESFGDYLTVHTKTNKFTIKERISHFEKELPQQQFLRVHRGYIVSVFKITALLPGLIEINEHKIPIGRSYKETVEQIIK